MTSDGEPPVPETTPSPPEMQGPAARPQEPTPPTVEFSGVPEASSHTVRRELVAYLNEDSSRLGEVYRALESNLSGDQIASELGVASSNFVWNYRRIISALLDADLPSAPTVALGVARRIRSLLKQKHWSPSAHEYLENLLSQLETRAEDTSARAAEDITAKKLTDEAESKNEVGIYVYALPHYLRYPFEPKSGRTLMKVGHSNSDVIKRFRQQTRTTALPEEPVLLRIYPVDMDTAIIERRFHAMLEAADHDRSVARTAGREWFVTSTKFLDALAELMNLPVQVINDAEIVDEL